MRFLTSTNPINGSEQRNVTKFKKDDLKATASLQP